MAWTNRLFSIIEWRSIAYGNSWRSLSGKEFVTLRQSIRIDGNQTLSWGLDPASIVSEA